MATFCKSKIYSNLIKYMNDPKSIRDFEKHRLVTFFIGDDHASEINFAFKFPLFKRGVVITQFKDGTVYSAYFTKEECKAITIELYRRAGVKAGEEIKEDQEV